jgi:tetratricopeptide (TPR) repeat protein
MNRHIRPLFSALTIAACLAGTGAWADAGLDKSLLDVQHQWAHVMYQVPDKDKGAAFAKLDREAKAVADRYPNRAEPLIWEAISLSGHAKAEGGLTGLGMAKGARELLVKAEQIDPKALDGSVYSSLGGLYAKVPGWPLGFGDKDQAESYFKKALALNPNGIDPNYLYGDFLFEQQRYKEAERVLEHALKAPTRPSRPLADQGRTREVQALLGQVRTKLADAGTRQASGG